MMRRGYDRLKYCPQCRDYRVFVAVSHQFSRCGHCGWSDSGRGLVVLGALLCAFGLYCVLYFLCQIAR